MWRRCMCVCVCVWGKSTNDEKGPVLRVDDEEEEEEETRVVGYYLVCAEYEIQYLYVLWLFM